MRENRETTNAAMDQAISCFAGDIAPFDDAQGRLRQGGRFSILFTKNSLSEFFVNKKKSTMLPQANRASTWANVQFA